MCLSFSLPRPFQANLFLSLSRRLFLLSGLITNNRYDDISLYFKYEYFTRPLVLYVHKTGVSLSNGCDNYTAYPAQTYYLRVACSKNREITLGSTGTPPPLPHPLGGAYLEHVGHGTVRVYIIIILTVSIHIA